MKNIILTSTAISLLCLSTAGYARDLNKGTIEIGGGLNLSMISEEYKAQDAEDPLEIDSRNFAANVLYYVAPNIGLGINWNYQSEEAKFGDSEWETTTSMIGPVAAYNISLGSNTSLKLVGSVVRASEENGDSTLEGFGWTLGGQFHYFLNDFVSLNGSLKYVSISLEDDDSNNELDNTSFRAGVGLSIYLK